MNPVLLSVAAVSQDQRTRADRLLRRILPHAPRGTYIRQDSGYLRLVVRSQQVSTTKVRLWDEM